MLLAVLTDFPHLILLHRHNDKPSKDTMHSYKRHLIVGDDNNGLCSSNDTIINFQSSKRYTHQ